MIMLATDWSEAVTETYFWLERLFQNGLSQHFLVLSAEVSKSIVCL